MQKNTIYVDHDSKLVAEKFRDGADLLQIRLCTQISCPLLVAVNFRNSFWSAKNTGRSQEYFLQVFQINKQQTIQIFAVKQALKSHVHSLLQSTFVTLSGQQRTLEDLRNIFLKLEFLREIVPVLYLIDCCSKFATGLKCLNRHRSKNM